MKPQFPRFLSGGLVVICGILATGATAAPPAGSTPAGGGGFLEGTATWNMPLVQEYFKKDFRYETDVPAQPAPFAYHEMLDQVNPEFKQRIEALMAVCQSLGENDLGITPRDGGLRDAAMQTKLYEEGRRIKIDNPATKTVDESKRDGKKRDGSVKDDWEKIPGGQTVTEAWGLDGSSWHQYGVAVDVAWCPGGRYNNSATTMHWKDKNGKLHVSEVPNPASPMYRTLWVTKAADAAAAMGLCPGLWWPTKPDRPHIEWHLRRGHAPPQELRSAAGKALSDSQVNTGYQWKIPDKVYSWHGNVDNPKFPQVLWVSELVVDGNWICIKKQRVISRSNDDGSWRGQWTTFDPPVKMFPAWIPTTELRRSEKEWPDDKKWRDKTHVTVEFGEHGSASDEKTREGWSEATGDWHYYPSRSEATGDWDYYPKLQVQDMEKQANQQLWHRLPDQARWAKLRKSSVYDIDSTMEWTGDKEPTTEKGRRANAHGYTEDWTSQGESSILQGLWLRLSWNRETGQIGVHGLISIIDPAVRELDVKGVHCGDGEDCWIVSAKKPKEAFDQETPPEWPPVQKEPKGKPDTGSGFLRP